MVVACRTTASTPTTIYINTRGREDERPAGAARRDEEDAAADGDFTDVLADGGVVQEMQGSGQRTVTTDRVI